MNSYGRFLLPLSTIFPNPVAKKPRSKSRATRLRENLLSSFKFPIVSSETMKEKNDDVKQERQESNPSSSSSESLMRSVPVATLNFREITIPEPIPDFAALTRDISSYINYLPNLSENGEDDESNVDD